ncbi:MAG: spermidine/putrescine ABC transporter substrate-binding protein [Lentisphaeria bacterium]|nr:spermidine/putrescine ABC transporter substrate-binding protein [Lentisphaeria bacterium]
MKRFFSLLPAILLALVLSSLTACGKKEVLHIYCWEDYLSDDVIKKFEKEYNCKIQLDVFPSNEAMYAKLKGGAAGYDVVVPSSYMAKLMNEQNMLLKLDTEKLPNVKKYYDKKYNVLNLDPNHEYSVPYFISFTGIGYNSKKVKNFVPSWRMFERADLKGKMSLLDDQREVIGCALRTLGYDVNTTDQKQIDAAVELARKWKKNIAKFGVDDARLSLAQGEFDLIQTYSGDMLQYAVDNPDLKFVIPKEGTTATFDNLCILNSSSQKELAYKFIDFLYRVDIAAENMDFVYYRMAHTEAIKHVGKEIRNHEVFNVDASTFNRCTPLRDLGKDQKKYNDAWDAIKK